MTKSGDILDLLKNEYFVQWIVAPTQESTHYWSKWMASHPERKQDMETAIQVIRSGKYQIDESMPEDDYDFVLENIVNYSLKSRRKDKKLTEKTWWRPLSVAASIAILLFASLFIVLNQVQVKEEAVAVTMIEKEAPLGQRVTTVLPDGTMVKLNANSKLIAPSRFEGATREVTLTGEAFFDVQRDASHPFIIKTNKVDVEVLGTSFNIRSYPEETQVNVAVWEGKVAVSSAHEKVVLVQNEMANYRGSDDRIEKGNIPDALSIFGWKDGKLVFKDQDLHAIAESLSRWFGVDFEISSGVNWNKSVTATYQNPSLNEVLESLSHTYHFEYKVDGKKVTIK